ncbi:hypothetical protein DPMN_154637 [Dreissena polymorpha]|uniref:Uncharacterized protein n=1 Tax=Dreissena polymorpha TaxID=45954 RepID=A0A9D4FLD9_DREPO|nr:hypothetical protein DPMN_154637 [Dreissena polymorpha]
MTQFRTQSRYQCDKCSAKFHEDQTINVASRVFTRQNVDDIQRTTDKRQSQKLTMSMLHSDIIYIQLLTKFGEDRMKYRGQTDKRDSYIAPITNCNRGININFRPDGQTD